MNVAIERYTLGKLRTLFAQRILAVPEIQREFVWNPRKVCMLLDSLFRGYPVGTALIWKTASRNRNDLRERLHLLPHFDPTNREIWFIVDGQQRLSVLYHVLCRDELDREAGRRFRPHLLFRRPASRGYGELRLSPRPRARRLCGAGQRASGREGLVRPRRSASPTRKRMPRSTSCCSVLSAGHGGRRPARRPRNVYSNQRPRYAGQQRRPRLRARVVDGRAAPSTQRDSQTAAWLSNGPE
ncbi:MAG: DUF262 domain-containing protein [Burkholderiales bacterium]|nr:MAG: DUF262 domain-containing protein [Burkholderiales bacterium]